VLVVTITSLHRPRIARLFTGARKNTELGQAPGAVAGANDDGGGLVTVVLSEWSKADFFFLLTANFSKTIFTGRLSPFGTGLDLSG